MTLDAPSQQLTSEGVQKPTTLKTSPGATTPEAVWCSGGVIGVLLLAACGTTPIEAVTADLPAPADTGEMTPPAGSGCSVPTAGRFSLSEQGLCLRRGEPTTVFGNPAFLTEISADCSTPRAQWDLTPAVAGTFTVRNVEDQLSLDVRAASDLPGTPVIVYDPNTLDNQRFWFRPRSAETYELAPRHAPTLCVRARTTGVEIWPCDPNDVGQTFRFAGVSCP
jgi:hypothetical protein